MARILVIDDDQLVQRSFSRLFRDKGHEVVTADTLADGSEAARSGVDVIYLDLDLPDGDGLRLIDNLSAMPGKPEVIVITGMGSDYAARKSMESNAWDYISKPASPSAVLQTLESALTYREKARKNQTEPTPLDPCGILGASPAIQRVLRDIGKAAASDAAVLIRGETGVGKELAARSLHQNSGRKACPFVVVDCSNLSESLVESTLYGHVKGAFTGAHADREGLVAQADGGTLFLDEVGELPLELQKSFLRVLQERKFRKVGGTKELSSDFRLLAATNRDLSAMVAQGRFRADLLYRLKTVELLLPPLRERGEDAELLTDFFMKRTCERYGLDEKEISKELVSMVKSYPWPGNIRELANVMDAAVVQAGPDPVLYPKHLPAHIRIGFLKHRANDAAAPRDLPRPPGENPPPAQITTYAEHKQQSDRTYFDRVLTAAQGDITRVSTISGLSVPSIYRYLAGLGISAKSYREG